jgi:hypothetical protein
MSVLTVLVNPVKTFKIIFENNIKHIAALFILGSIWCVTQVFWEVESGISLWSSILMNLLIYLSLGWVVFTIISFAMYYGSKLLKGGSSIYQNKTVLAWSFLPGVFFVVSYVLVIAIFGIKIVTNVDVNPTFSLVRDAINIFKIITGLWSCYILVKGMSYINNFSLSKTILMFIGVYGGLSMIYYIFNTIIILLTK